MSAASTGKVQRKGHKATAVALEGLPFYESMAIVQQRTGIEYGELLTNQAGFRATPSRCACGHEWSMFDVVIESVNQTKHEWAFFVPQLTGKFDGFFENTFELTCRCGTTTPDVKVLYQYRQAGAPYDTCG